MFEVSRFGIQELDLKYSSTAESVILGGAELYIEYGVREEFRPGVFVTPFTFIKGKLSGQADGAHIYLRPGATTGIQSFGEESNIFIETTSSGSGKWLGISPEGEQVRIDFSEGDPNPPVIAYGPGWKGTWVAGENGLSILELCTPPFDEEIEIPEIDPLDEALPLLFQAQYLSLFEICNLLDLKPSEPIVVSDALTVVEYLSETREEDTSIAEISLKGWGRKVVNHLSDTAYCVRVGKVTFIDWYTGEQYVHHLEEGDVFFVPKGTEYRDFSEDGAILMAVSRPRYNDQFVEEITT